MIKILVNTISSKNYAGGTFQIAYNFLLKTLEHQDIEWYYITSKDLDLVIGDKFRHLRNVKYYVFETQPDIKKTYWKVRKQLKILEKQISPDVVYSIVAPSYFSFRSTEVMRYTYPWVTHPNEYSWKSLSLKDKIYYRIYGLVQKYLMRSAQYFITQTETCKKGIIDVTGLSESHVKVVENVLPAVYNEMDVNPILDNYWVNIACIGKPVPHKNFDIIPDVLIELKKIGINNVKFHTTIPDTYPLAKQIASKLDNSGMIDNWVNYGRVSQQTLGEIYRRCQICFLPTLLEVFSACTVEAMYFGLPTVATNFSFNSDVMGDSCLYYEPMNAKDAAIQICSLINDYNLQSSLKEKMKKQLLMYGDYNKHFNSIKDFLVKVVLEKNNKLI